MFAAGDHRSLGLIDGVDHLVARDIEGVSEDDAGPGEGQYHQKGEPLAQGHVLDCTCESSHTAPSSVM